VIRHWHRSFAIAAPPIVTAATKRGEARRGAAAVLRDGGLCKHIDNHRFVTKQAFCSL
jgi:hypothetical protein